MKPDAPPLAAVRQALESAGLWRTNARLLAAVSGGPDSTALLWCLRALAEDGGYALLACHVRHGLRGEAGLRDERQTQALCHSLGVPLTVLDAKLTITMDDPGAETVARERRRKLFLECMEQTGAQALLTAHHLDDQAETVLMRLCRGAGGQGLGGIAQTTSFGSGLAVRPFLALPKAALLQILQEAGVSYCVDESNLTPCTPRNALRLEVLPQLERLYPGASRHLAQAAQTLRRENELLASLADGLYVSALCDQPPLFALERAPLNAAHQALSLRALRRFYREGLERMGLAPKERELSQETSLALCALLPGQSLNLPQGMKAMAGNRYLYLLLQSGAPLTAAPPPPVIPLAAAAGRYALCGVRVELSPAVSPLSAPRSAREAYLPERLLPRCTLRAPLPGDSLRPLGTAGAKPLRRFLTDRKVDAPLRPILPVLALEGRVLWIPGLVTSQELRFTPEEKQWRIALIGGAPYLEKE